MHPKLAKICRVVGLRWCAPKMPEKKPYVPPTPPDVQEEIEIFRKEEEAAQQTFFAYLGIRDLLAKRPDVLAAVNRNSMFWLTTNHALFVSTFIWLGRIFDQKSAHNIDFLLKAVEQNLPELGRDALRKRKEEVITPQQAADYVKDRHDTVIDDVRELRKQVKAWRKIYEPVYGEVRDHLAHNKQGVSEIDPFLEKTNIDEMKRMFGFLHALHQALIELYLNGRNPLPLPDVTFNPPPARPRHPGDKAYAEAQASLLSMVGE
jgi:AbiU2